MVENVHSLFVELTPLEFIPLFLKIRIVFLYNVVELAFNQKIITPMIFTALSKMARENMNKLRGSPPKGRPDS